MIISKICKVGLKIIFPVKCVKIYTVQNIYQVFCNAGSLGCISVGVWGVQQEISMLPQVLRYISFHIFPGKTNTSSR